MTLILVFEVLFYAPTHSIPNIFHLNVFICNIRGLNEKLRLLPSLKCMQYFYKSLNLCFSYLSVKNKTIKHYTQTKARHLKMTTFGSNLISLITLFPHQNIYWLAIVACFLSFSQGHYIYNGPEKHTHTHTHTHTHIYIYIYFTFCSKGLKNAGVN